jgi:DNA-3-methyladenine glycosylase I
MPQFLGFSQFATMRLIHFSKHVPPRMCGRNNSSTPREAFLHLQNAMLKVALTTAARQRRRARQRAPHRGHPTGASCSMPAPPPAKKPRRSSGDRPARWFAGMPNMDEEGAEYWNYMASEWGRPTHGEQALFEMLTLEGAQAGLSWRTILVKRAAYRAAFHDFDVDAVAAMGPSDIERLLAKPKAAGAKPADAVVRHKAKLQSVISNAVAVQQLRSHESGGLDGFLWSFVGHEPQFTTARTASGIPATTPAAEKMSKELKALGFKFVGTQTTVSLQACVMGLALDRPAESLWAELSMCAITCCRADHLLCPDAELWNCGGSPSRNGRARRGQGGRGSGGSQPGGWRDGPSGRWRQSKETSAALIGL